MITENTTGPFSVFFTNVNRQMQLSGHSHFATVKFRYRAKPWAEGACSSGHGPIKELAFPSFENTHRDVQEELKSFFKEPFRDHTNEDICRALFQHFKGWTTDTIKEWGGAYDLVAVELAVRGVPDKIGHADGFTVYEVRDQ